jgi:hypothetical protein
VAAEVLLMEVLGEAEGLITPLVQAVAEHPEFI